MSKQTVIVSGGALEEEFTLNILNSEDTELGPVGVYCGLGFLYDQNENRIILLEILTARLPKSRRLLLENTDVPIRTFNPVHASDTEQTAMRLVWASPAGNFACATGNRMDHAWANVTLKDCAAGAEAVIMDPWNKIRLINGNTVLKKDEAYGKDFLSFPLGQTVVDFSIKGAKYPLNHHTLTPWDSLCVSNEFAADEAEIRHSTGMPSLMETRISREKRIDRRK